MSVSFTVYGAAAVAGSKRGFYNAKAKRVIITDDSARSRAVESARLGCSG